MGIMISLLGALIGSLVGLGIYSIDRAFDGPTPSPWKILVYTAIGGSSGFMAAPGKSPRRDP